MEKHVLAFVMNPDGNQVFVHLDEGGAQIMILELQRLIDQLRRGDAPYFQLFSGEWSHQGDLSVSTMIDSAEKKGLPVHLVKVYGWTDEWVDKHGFERRPG